MVALSWLKPYRRPVRAIWDWIWPIAVGMLIAKVILRFVFMFANVPSGSMYPTIPVNPSPPPGQVATPSYIFVNRLAVELGHLHRGEVIVFPFPDDPTQNFVKRIIGLPGDTVTIHSGHVYIDGRPLPEPYLNTPYGVTSGTYGPFHVPANSYFVMGDNRNNSDDSRFWIHKFVPKWTIIGSAEWVIWPLRVVHHIPQ